MSNYSFTSHGTVTMNWELKLKHLFKNVNMQVIRYIYFEIWVVFILYPPKWHF